MDYICLNHEMNDVQKHVESQSNFFVNLIILLLSTYCEV